MNKHMKHHAQRLNIKTTHLASLTAVFHSKKRPQPPITGHSHPPVVGTDEGDRLDGPDSRVGGSVPEELALQLNGSGTDDDGRNDSDETSKGVLGDSDSDEFESDGEGVSCGGTEKGQRLLDFELRAAGAGNVHCEHKILLKN